MFKDDFMSRLTQSKIFLIGLIGVLIAVVGLQPIFVFLSRSAELPAVLQRHLIRAETAADAAIDEQLQILDEFFAKAKQNTRGFADAALGWSSKWRLVVDHVPFMSGDRQSRFLRVKFEEHIFRPAQLDAAVQQVILGYLVRVERIENQLLMDLRADLSDVPSDSQLRADGQRTLYRFDEALAHALAASRADLQADVATQLMSIIAGEVLTQVTVTMGVSAGILGTGAAAGWATFGVGLVVGLIVDQVISWVWDWCADPRGTLAAELNTKLDEIHRLIVEGSADVPGLRKRLLQLVMERATTRRNVIQDVLKTGTENAKRDLDV